MRRSHLPVSSSEPCRMRSLLTAFSFLLARPSILPCSRDHVHCQLHSFSLFLSFAITRLILNTICTMDNFLFLSDICMYFSFFFCPFFFYICIPCDDWTLHINENYPAFCYFPYASSCIQAVLYIFFLYSKMLEKNWTCFRRGKQ